MRALVEHMLRSGDLVLEFSPGSRQVEGIYAHQKVQRSRPAEYSKEVTVSHQLETEDFILDIGGRIDGVYEYPDRVIIEEIKSTTRNLEVVEQAENQRHWGQLKVYAYFYANRHQSKEIEVRLTYYQIDTAETLELNRKFTYSELDTFFQDLAARYLDWARKMEQWFSLRNESSENLQFPYESYRPGQHKMAVTVYHTIETSGELIVQAPTGIGKTMAALFPTLKALGRGFLSKFFYLTARTTGKNIAEKALQELRQQGLKLKSLTLTAREKICFKPGSACNAEECEFARGYYDRIDEALQEFFEQDVFCRETIEDLARKYQVCPFEFSLELSLWADGIICDYNYVFDPAVYLRRFFGEEETRDEFVFLIDEAHNLVDRARQMFSAELFKQPFLDLRNVIKGQLPEVYKAAGKINTWLKKMQKRFEEEGRPLAEKEPPAEIYLLLRKFNRAAEQWLARNIKTPFRDELLNLFFQVSSFLRTAEQYDDTYATCYEPVDRDFRLKLFCLDPSRQLEEALKRCQAVVLFSATMTPSHYFRQILGCRPEAQTLTLASPFPAENLCLLVGDKISTLYRHREMTRLAVSRALACLVKQKSGNYLLFFPSYQYMMMVYELFLAQDRRPDMEIIVQTPGMSETERDLFLARFSEENENPHTLVGFAVMGGVFGEGIDLVGDRLTGAAVVGVGLPGISLERDLIREYFADPEKGGTGFEYAYLFPGFNRVLQAAGRVIRSENDRGVVFLIDERFSRQQYRSLFPQEWNPCRVSDENHMRQILQEFWSC